MKPVHLYPTLAEHCLCLDLFYLFIPLCFSHPPCDLTLCSGFRLCKRDEFAGISLILPSSQTVNWRLSVVSAKNAQWKKAQFMFHPLSKVFTIIQSHPKMFHLLTLSQDITGSDGPRSCLRFHSPRNCISSNLQNTVWPPTENVVGRDSVIT